MVSYKIVNPAAGNVYFNTAGSAQGANGSTLGSGVVFGLGSDQTGESNVRHGIDVSNVIGGHVVSGVHGQPATTAGVFGQQTDGNYVMKRVTDSVAGGVVNTSLRSGAAHYVDHRHSVHKVTTAIRHVAVATAIRNGFWNDFSGIFTTAPTNTNNSIGNVAGSTVSDGSADHEASGTRNSQGEFSFRDGSPTVVRDVYGPKLG
jgi:hypothetical protein